MQVLLIGGSGFAGTAIAEHFLSRNDRVAVVSRGNKPVPVGTEPLLADRKDASAFASAIGGRTFDLAIDMTAFNAGDVNAVLPALSRKAGHYVLISTDFVYATDIEQIPITEDAPKDPDSGYAVGKLAAEAVMLAGMHDHHLPGTALRPPHIMGAGKELGTTTVQGRDRNLLRSMRAGTGLTMLAEGELLIQPVWHRQIAEAIEAVAGNPATFGQVMNCPGGEAVTTRRYYQLIADRLGVPLKCDSVSVDRYRAENPDKRAFARHRVYDVSKLRNLAGYIARPQLAEAIDETVTWMEKNC
jgi:nucleoside-diphosphate-sugar epimerase